MNKQTPVVPKNDCNTAFTREAYGAITSVNEGEGPRCISNLSAMDRKRKTSIGWGNKI